MKFNKKIDIAGHLVGPKEPVLFIAEAGLSHFGSIDKAYRLVDLARESGADVFKTQAFKTDELVSGNLIEWKERLQSKEVGFDFLQNVKERCDDVGITFMCTAHDETVVPWLEMLKVPAFKIGSGERGNLPFISSLAKHDLPLILSTGMYEQSHVLSTLDAIEEAGCNQVALLHCVTSYPVPISQVNLGSIATLRSFFPGPVGYSDHTEGYLALVAAVALGANILEKHISLDFNVPNAQDWKVSAGPHNLKKIINRVRETEQSLGDGILQVAPCEEEALGWALKRIVARRDLKPGIRLTMQDFSLKRAGSEGILASELSSVLNRELLSFVGKDVPLLWQDIKS